MDRTTYTNYLLSFADNDPATCSELSDEEMEQDFEREIEYDPNE